MRREAGALAIEMNAPRQLGHRRLRIFVALAVCLSAAWQGIRLSNSLLALHLGATPATIGLLIALYSLFPMVGSIAIGRTVDRLGAFRPVVASAAVMTLALVAPFLLPTLPILFLSAGLFGTASTVCQIALLSLVARLGESDERALNLSWYTTGWAVGGVFGPMLAGLLIDTLGFRIAFILLTPFTLAILLAFVALRAMRRRSGGTAPPLSPDVAGERRVIDLLRAPRLRDSIIIGAAVSAVLDLFGFVVPVFGSQVGFTSSTIGIIVGCLSLASVTVRPALPAIMRRFGSWTLIAQMMALAAITYALFPLVHSALAWSVFACALGIVTGIGQPINHALIYAVSPPGRQGEAMGLRMATGHLIHVAGPVSFGALSTTIGLAPVIWAMSALLGYATWFSYVRARDGERLEQGDGTAGSRTGDSDGIIRQ